MFCVVQAVAIWYSNLYKINSSFLLAGMHYSNNEPVRSRYAVVDKYFLDNILSQIRLQGISIYIWINVYIILINNTTGRIFMNS